MSKKIIVSENDIITQINAFLIECDSDELARLAGEIFGGECYFISGDYNFYPNEENYYGAFGEAENE
jgi:hypothetical protein